MIASVSTANVAGANTETKKPAQIMYGAEFRAQMEVLRDRVRAERAAGKTNTSQELRDLTTEEIKELAAKFDPSNMSQAEYDAFLDELVEKNALRKSDTGALGYGGCIVVGIIGQPETFCTGYIVDGRNMSDWASRIKTLADAEGDALLWARLMSLWKPSGGSEAAIKAAEERLSVFEKLADILALMKDARV